MGIFILFFMVLFGIGMAITVGAIIYLIVKRVNEDREPYERREY